MIFYAHEQVLNYCNCHSKTDQYYSNPFWKLEYHSCLWKNCSQCHFIWRYVPGTPGAPWSHQEVLAVKSKLYSIFDRWGGNYALKQIYNGNDPSTWRDVPNGAKMLRLGLTWASTSPSNKSHYINQKFYPCMSISMTVFLTNGCNRMIFSNILCFTTSFWSKQGKGDINENLKSR